MSDDAIVRRAEYSLASPEPTAEPPDPFSQLRDELAALEDEATRLLSGQRENAEVELSPIRRVFKYATRLRQAQWNQNDELAKANEKNRLFAERLKQLEGIVQSAFARAVKGLSANAPAAQAGADKVVRLVEEHALASRFLDEHEVPGATMLARVQWLHDKATQTVVTEATEQFFTGVDLAKGTSRTVVVEVCGRCGGVGCHDCAPPEYR